MSKVKFTAWATNKETGCREYVGGEAVLEPWRSDINRDAAARAALQRAGYRDATVESVTTVE